MMLTLLYALTILVATSIGAISGLGGGVIIKPVFDLIGQDNATVIGIYSALAVFTMCLVSISRQMHKGFRFKVKIILLVSFGSVAGGLLGETIFSSLVHALTNNQVKLIQNLLLLVTLLFIICSVFRPSIFPKLALQNSVLIFSVGLFLGLISVFMGIGGGPLNVALFIMLFSFTPKQATVYSIATIFFAQLSKLILNILSSKLWQINLKTAIIIMLVAVIGGYIGTLINQRLSLAAIEAVYNVLMFLLTLVTVINIALVIV